MISIVIPCFNNEFQLADTVSRIQYSTSGLNQNFELILIDDGSTDQTWNVIQNIAKESDTIVTKGLRLKSNVGAYHAIVPGMNASTGDSIMIMAADGDDPPELIPQLIGLLDEDIELVQANKEGSEKGIISVFLSTVFNATLKLLGAKNIPVGGSDFMIFKRSLLFKCNEQGWKSGNTLIQLAQHAKHVKTVGYTKGKSKPSSWTFLDKMALFWNTVTLFLPVAFLQSALPEILVEDTC